MAFTVEDLQDLLRLLEQHPEWRGELRRWVLTGELLSLPQTVQALAEAQRRTEEQVQVLAGRVDALAGRVDALAEAQRRTEEQVQALARRVDALAEAQRRTEEQVQALAGRVDALASRVDALASKVEALAEAQTRMERMLGELAHQVVVLVDVQRNVAADLGFLKGFAVEFRYRTHAPSYFSPLIRRVHVLADREVTALLDEAVARGLLSEDEADELEQADLIVRGRWKPDGQEVYLVVEVSWGVGPRDVQRARKRADLLARTGRKAVPVAAGDWVTPDGQEAARSLKVWQLTDGTAQPPPS